MADRCRQGLVAQLDLEAVLREVVEVARELTGAGYAALGILNADRRELERFIYVGIDEETRATIGDLPRGRGVLGELICNPMPLRPSLPLAPVGGSGLDESPGERAAN